MVDNLRPEPQPRGPVRHQLKIWPPQFEPVADGRKRFEVRWNDRDYRVGDILDLQEWDPSTKDYTGRSTEQVVTHILQGEFGLPPTLCVMSIRPATAKDKWKVAA